MHAPRRINGWFFLDKLLKLLENGRGFDVLAGCLLVTGIT